MDSGFPPRSNFVDVSVKILDENDNSPTFREEILGRNLSVSEDTSPGTVISKIQAQDADDGEYGKVTYFLDRRSALGKFTIHPDSGELSVAEPLDREEENTYNLIVQAYDNYQFGFTTGESRNAFAQITVQVTDVNDETPVFKEVADVCALITEFHEITEPILTVRASDADDPETENGRLSFTIKAGNDLGLFRIEEAGRTASKLFPNRQLKGFYGNYTLTVEARDRGMPPNAAIAEYGICVQVGKDNLLTREDNTSIKLTRQAPI